ncbi:hypothetical protein KC19_12G074100 [Ceratodon purpureus]|uniref:Uncharacterized protein n=1 Tax=Ceratodon purpureus TaxID=3225 RepID=A0A8T0GAB3_CERPU|nr:hypothetical protein KC19_12G074100 [Ceratodon purpureus]
MDTCAARDRRIENLEITESPHVTTIRDILGNVDASLGSSEYHTPPWTPLDTEKSALFRVTECLIAIDKHSDPIYKKALEYTTNEATVRARRVEELESRSDKLKTVIFQVVGFYLVFQGVMITVVAQSTLLQKGTVWSPMTLSGAAAACCIIPVWQKGWAIAHIKGDMHDEREGLQVASKARKELERLGAKYTFPPSRQQPKKPNIKCYFIPYLLIIVFIFVFTGLILISQWKIRHP